MRYLPLARSLARPMKERFPSLREEFESAACLALVEAAESFDAGREVKFSTHARHRITGGLRDVLRDTIPHGYRHRGEPAPGILPLGPHAEEHGRVLLSRPDPPAGSEAESIEAVERRLRKLPPKYAATLRRIYLYGQTHAQIAGALGLSESRICWMHTAALSMLGDTL